MVCKDNSLSNLYSVSPRITKNKQLLALQPPFAASGWSPGFVNQRL